MQYLFLAAVIAYWSYRYVRRRRNNKRKAEAAKRVDMHIEYSKELFKCFEETKDLSYLEYSNEEIDKAQTLIDLNNSDQQRL